MSDPEQPGGFGNKYRNIRINEGAKAQLGDIYHIGKLFVYIKENHDNTDTR
jgi:hypothetical protein